MMVDDRFTTYLRDQIGLDPGSIGVEGVRRAVKLRAAECVQGDLNRYWDLLVQSDEERQALIEAVVVPETWFFRYPESIAFLVSRVTHWITRLGGERPVRLITLPCSTGEEPYTIAMALLDAGVLPAQFTIAGLDVSPAAIAKAKRARYGKNSFRGDARSFQLRHFLTDGPDYVLTESVKQCVSFRCENIFELSAETLMLPYDIVFCRNLLIYFDRATQTRALDTLTRICRADGDLFVGPAEASLLTRLGYKSIGNYQAFAFGASKWVPPSPVGLLGTPAERSTLAAAGLPAFAGTKGKSGQTPGAGPKAKQGPTPGADPKAKPGPTPIAETFAKPRFLPKFAALKSPLHTGESPQPDSPVEEIRTLANAGRVDEALALAQRATQSDRSNAELFYLVGLCLDAKGEVEQASVQYRKALYLAPSHVEALTHLAAILDAEGDGVAAERLRGRAAREEARDV